MQKKISYAALKTCVTSFFSPVAQNLCNSAKLNVLDLSENYLEKKEKDAIHRLGKSEDFFR